MATADAEDEAELGDDRRTGTALARQVEEPRRALHDGGDAGGQQQPGEHPREGLAEEAADSARGRADAELRRQSTLAYGSGSGSLVRFDLAPCGSVRVRVGRFLLCGRLRRSASGRRRVAPPPARRPVRGPRADRRAGSGTVAVVPAINPRAERDGAPLRSAEDRPRHLERGADRVSRPGPRTRAASSIVRLHLRRSAVDALDHRSDTRVWPSTRRSQASGLVASSAPATNSSRWKRRMRSARPAEARRQHVRAALDAELRAGEPEGGYGFVDRAVGLGPGVVLVDPVAAEEQARRAVVALAGRDGRVEARELGRCDASVTGGAHHIRPASRGSQRSASRVTLTGCSTTDSACSCTWATIDPA